MSSNYNETTREETYGTEVLRTCVPFPLPECHWIKDKWNDVTY